MADERGDEDAMPDDLPPTDVEAGELPDGMVPLPSEYRRGPGGCGFTGCTYAVMVLFVVALVLLLIGLATRIWITPPALR